MPRSYSTIHMIIGRDHGAWAAINVGVADYSCPSIYRGPSRSPNELYLSSACIKASTFLIEAMSKFTAKLPRSSYDRSTSGFEIEMLDQVPVAER